MKKLLRPVLAILLHKPLYKLLFISILVATFYSCSIKEQKKYVIGFSQCVDYGTWRQAMLAAMKRELSFHPDVNFIYKQADGDSKKQIVQVRELLNQNIDILIISPNEAEPLRPIVEEAFNRGTPVIVLDRKISSSMYTAYVGGDNYEIGKMAGEYAVHLLKGKGKILEITGLPKSSPAIERHNGFLDALKNHPSLTIVKQVNGEWLKQQAQDQLSETYPNTNADLIYVHNDKMANGVQEFFISKGIINKPKIIGVDGLIGKGEGIELVNDKKITATMLYPTGGEEAIQIATKILNKDDYKKENSLPTTVIDSTNVRLMQQQANKIYSQQHDIERQQKVLTEQIRTYNSQRTYLYFLVSSLFIAIGLGGTALYSLIENRKINKKLKLKNIEIENQKEQLIEMSAKAQAANEAKVNFFTNISHEFRTPLTLILGPLEELLLDNRKHSPIYQSHLLIQKNVFRLLRLVNQLINFRKIEVGKMKLKATENDLVPFISGIVEAYKDIAHKRNIDLRIITKERELKHWYDINMLDKVIFNLLSNAFKFTKDNGYIYVFISKNSTGDSAVIKVEDNGVGMSKEALTKIFEPFNQGDHENIEGSGLGLALSKELIQLHKGSISVNSEKNIGTSFEIYLPLGNSNLEENEITELTEGEATEIISYENEKVYTTELAPEEKADTELESISKERELSVLVIEDNNDLRNFIKTKLQSNYQIFEAENGETAIQQAFDALPDLIICDVVIPVKDGLTLVNIFKSDIRTSHIPVILLTAKTGIEVQIEAMEKRADIYITKPFNVRYLEQTIKSLLANRARLKEHFTGDISSNIKTQAIGKIDKKFISEFTSLVESNLSNHDFSVEDICKNMSISRVQLYKKVKALLNINVNDYIINSRIQKAKYLLQHVEISISEIASQVGFSSAGYFSTVFKSKFGVTPKEYKENTGLITSGGLHQQINV